jgi:hypothetical protein
MRTDIHAEDHSPCSQFCERAQNGFLLLIRMYCELIERKRLEF